MFNMYIPPKYRNRRVMMTLICIRLLGCFLHLLQTLLLLRDFYFDYHQSKQSTFKTQLIETFKV